MRAAGPLSFRFRSFLELVLAFLAPAALDAAPQTPTWVQVIGVTPTHYFIHWDVENNPPDTKFEVFRSERSDGGFERVATLPQADQPNNRNRYDDKDRDAQKTFFYQVRACPPQGDCSQVTPIAATPQRLESPNFRIFFNTAFAPPGPPGATDQVNVVSDDRNTDGENIYARVAADIMEGALREYRKQGFKDPPRAEGADRFTLNLKVCDGGGCGGIPMSIIPSAYAKHDPANRQWDPFGLVVSTHEFFHNIQASYGGASTRDSWVLEGQPRALQDLLCVQHPLDPCANVDGDGAHLASFYNEAKAYLQDPQPLRRMSYRAALFWIFLCQTYGKQAAEPQRGLDFLREFGHQVEHNPDFDGIDIISNTLKELGYEDRFLQAWRRFLVANYTRELPGGFTYLDETQPPGSWGALTVKTHPTLFPVTQIGPALSDTGSWQPKYFEFQPSAEVTDIHVDFRVDSPHPGHFSLIADGPSGINVIHHAGLTFTRSFPNRSYRNVAVVVTGMEHSVNFRYSVNAKSPILQIVHPTQNQPVQVGDPAGPRKFLLRLEVLHPDGSPVEGLQKSEFSFAIALAAVPSANVLTMAYVQGQYWFIIEPPARPAGGKVDVSARWNDLSWFEAEAVDYNGASNVGDTVLVVDRSNSMNQPSSKIFSAKEAGKLYVDSFRSGDEIGVVSFDCVPTTDMLVLPWDVARDQSLVLIDSISAAGGTSIGSGLSRALTELERGADPARPWAVLLLSDGVNACGDDILKYTAVHDARVKTGQKVPVVHTVAIGGNANRRDLQDLAAATGGQYHFAAEPPGSKAGGNGGGNGGGVGFTAADFHLDLSEIHREVSEELTGHAQVLSARGTLGPLAGQTQELFVDVLGTELVVAVSCLPRMPRIILADPATGNPIAPFESTAQHAVFRIHSPAPGKWKVGLINSPCNPETPCAVIEYLVEASVESEIRMDLFLGLPVEDRIVGAPMPILVSLTAGGLLTQATVDVEVARPLGGSTSLELFDDGRHGDGAAGDAVYGNVLRNTTEDGTYQVVATAFGVPNTLVSFERRRRAFFIMDGVSDPDKDGMASEYETLVALDPNRNDAQEDPDEDGLTNVEEFARGTKPRDADTDDDGEADGSETAHGRDPLDPSDGVMTPPRICATAGVGKVLIRSNVPPNAAAFDVYRAEGPKGAFERIRGGLPAASSFVFADTTAVNGTLYRYRLVSVRGSRDRVERSAPSEPCEATPHVDPYPPHGQVLINNGAPVTDSTVVLLSLFASDDPRMAEYFDDAAFDAAAVSTGVEEMLIANHASFEGKEVLSAPFEKSVKWAIEPGASGIATVFVRFIDGAGNLSDTVHASIRVGELPPPQGKFKRGDANADGILDLSDPVTSLGYLFLGLPAELACEKSADSNDDGGLDISDPVSLLEHLFLGGAPPAAPAFPLCGTDPTADQLHCDAYTHCPL